jgi:hypothetical protein
MPLSPEQMQRIEEEERLRIEEELQQARRHRTAGPAAGSGVRLAALFLLGFALASLFIAWRWRQGETRPAADSGRARTRSAEAPAVFGEKKPAALPDDPALLRQTDVPESNSPETAGNVPTDILRFLERWERSLENRDLDTQAACYAPVVERFYTKSNVSLSDVIAEKRQLLDTYPKFNKYEISNIRVHSLTPQRAWITFNKTWDTSGNRRRFAGSEQQRLVLTKINGDWKIIREEEPRVYWVRRS